MSATSLNSTGDKRASEMTTQWKSNIWKVKTAGRLINSSLDMVELTADGTSIMVHKALLCFYSPYHDKLLNGPFSEGQQGGKKSTSALHTSHKAMQLFSTWLYTGKVRSYSKNVYADIVDLYILADSLNMTALMRGILSTLHGDHVQECEILSYKMVTKIASNTPTSSPLMQFVKDTYLWHWTPEADEEDNNISQSGVDISFVYNLLVLRSKPKLEKHKCCLSSCGYHDHESKEERKATCGSLDANDFEEDDDSSEDEE